MRPVSEEEALLDEERRQKLRAAARNGSAGDGPVDSLPWHDALPAALTPRPWRLPIVDRHFRWELRSWDEHDFARTGRQATWGAFLGVWAHSWFKILDRWFGSSPTTRIALLKNVSDMVLYQPVTICAFTSLTGVMMGKTGGELVERLKTVFPVVYTAVWVVWPPWNLFQFLVVPVHLRVVALNLLLIPWGCFVSGVACALCPSAVLTLARRTIGADEPHAEPTGPTCCNGSEY